MSFEERLEKCNNPLLKKLFHIIIEKKTNLCIAADFDGDFEKVSRLIDKVGQHICILKVHPCQFGLKDLEKNLNKLFTLKKKHNFLLFDDRKFFDGRETIYLDYKNACVKYFDLVTVVPDFGDAIFEAISDGVGSANLPSDEYRGCLAVCELSFKGFDNRDSKRRLEIATRNQSICVGIIGQKLRIQDKYSMIKLTPGINLCLASDGQNQQWRGPEEAIKDGSDIIIVGRGITALPEDQWESLAIKYKETSYRAHLDGLNNMSL